MSSEMMTELAALMRDLGEIDSEVKAIEYTRDAKRERIEEIVKAMGGKVEVMGIGVAQVSADSETHSYDTKAIDALIQTMIEDGELHTAKRIMTTKKWTKRKGSLRITLAK